MFGDDHVWQRRSPYSNRIAAGTSVLTHAVLAAFGIWLSTLPRSFASAESAPIARKDHLVWIASPGPGGGGGGGGDKTPVPAPAREAGKDRLTVPTTRSDPKPLDQPREPPPTERLEIPAKPLADATQPLPGVLEAPPSATATQGPGVDGGAGAGAGTGSGEGRGSGLGPGFGGGTGGCGTGPAAA